MVRAIILVLFASTHALASDPIIVGHRGLPTHAPEQTLATLSACMDLRIGVEIDIHRTRDGQLVCLHDAVVDRTTDGRGKVAELSLREIKQLDAGSRFDAAFAGERISTLEEFFALLKERKSSILVAIDLKESDCEREVVKLGAKYGVLSQLVFIGLAIEDAKVRHALKEASPSAVCAVLCPAAEKLGDATADSSAEWVYLRFIPAPDDVKAIHAAGRKVFLVGPLVMGNEPANWAKARAAGVDALLTDHPLECRLSWRQKK